MTRLQSESPHWHMSLKKQPLSSLFLWWKDRIEILAKHWKRIVCWKEDQIRSNNWISIWMENIFFVKEKKRKICFSIGQFHDQWTFVLNHFVFSCYVIVIESSMRMGLRVHLSNLFCLSESSKNPLIMLKTVIRHACRFRPLVGSRLSTSIYSHSTLSNVSLSKQVNSTSKWLINLIFFFLMQ